MKVADNLDIQSQKSLNSSKTGRKSLWIYLSLSATPPPTFDFVWSIACVIFIQSLLNLQRNRVGIKYLTSWKLSHIALFNTLELHALDCWHAGSQVSSRCPFEQLVVVLACLNNSRENCHPYYPWHQYWH